MFYKNLLSKFSILCIASVYSSITFSEELAPPQHQVIDEHGVNMASGQIAVSLDTVSIGGELGLTHNIATHHNNFVFAARRDAGNWPGGMSSFNDRFVGKAKGTEVAQRYGLIAGLSTTPIRIDGKDYYDFQVMRVHDLLGSEDFKIMVNGQVVAAAPSHTNYTYEALRDKRNKLVVNGAYLEWTKPDGTVSIFQRGLNAKADGDGALDKIIYPNGLTINISRSGDLVHSVSTNTGYQLKYIYEVDYRRAVYTGSLDLSLINTHPSSEGWSRLNPKYVIGINSSIEYCNPAPSAICNVSSHWPKASFLWPAGMPDSLYFGNNVFELVHPDNTSTKFYLEAQDRRKSYPDGDINEEIYANPLVTPRLAGIKSRSSSVRDKNYTYKNTMNRWNTGHGTGVDAGDTAGKVYGAYGKAGSVSGYYWFGALDQGMLNTFSLGGNDFEVKQTAELGGILKSVSSKKDGTFTFSTSLSNRLTSIRHANSVYESYGYDARGNVNFVSKGGIVRTAKYADSCTEQNYKYCNKAEWIEDAKGNRTNYEYHAESGQTEKITYPANAQGLVAETRFTYEKKFAKRKTSVGGTPISYDQGIWLKVSESYCINSNYNNGCALNDEVVTRYEYDSNNLHMTGVVIESGGQQRRTCNAYDQYGNQISITKPNANLSSCPAS